jgi:hypothetical protein
MQQAVGAQWRLLISSPVTAAGPRRFYTDLPFALAEIHDVTLVGAQITTVKHHPPWYKNG